MIDRFEIKLLGPGDCWRDARALPGGTTHLMCVDYRVNGEWRHYNEPLTNITPEHWQTLLEYLFDNALRVLLDCERRAAHEKTAVRQET